MVLVSFQPNVMINIVVMGEDSYYFFPNQPKIKHYIAFFVNTGAYRLEISKYYSSYIFHPISDKSFEDIDYHGGIQVIAFIANRPGFKAFKNLMSL